MDTRAKGLIEIGSGLFSKKHTFDSLCQELAEHFFPMRADFTRSFTLGNDFAEDVMDSTPIQARETLSNLPNAVLRQGDWFAPRTGNDELDEDRNNADWFDRIGKDMRKIVYDRRSNFVSAMNECDHDWVTFGNRIMSVEESASRTHFIYRPWHIKDCAWMENADGQVDCLHRKVPMTARSAYKRWKDKCHSTTKEKAQKSPSDPFEVRHIVVPTDEIYGDDRKMMRKYANFPFLSMYVDCENQIVLQEGGLPVMNYIVSRWRKVSPFQYGFSPATINCLADARMLQQLAMIILETGEKSLDPAMIGKGEIFREGLNAYAGGLTFVDLENDERLQDVFQTIQTGANMPIGMEMKQDVRMLIAESFLLNKINLPDVRSMTAFETEARLAEYRRAVLPFFGPYETEVHLPVLDVTFQMAMNAKMLSFKDMPEVLGGEEVTFTFESPLSTAEGRQKVASFQETMQIIAAVSQIDQTITTRYDLPKATDDAIRGTGAPADWFVDPEEVEAAKEAEAQAAQLQQVATALQGGAGVAGDVADATIKMQQAGLA